MKLLLAIVLGLFSMTAFTKDLNSKKEMMSTHLDQKISRLQEAKACIQGANTEEALKKCKKDMKKDMSAMKEDMKDKKKEMKRQSQESMDDDEMPEEDGESEE